MKKIFRHIELIFWLSALVWLLFVDVNNQHFTFCPISNLGLDFCPGCGLGKSISLIMTGEIQRSFESHPLGLFALIIILNRIFVLIFNKFRLKELYREPSTDTNVSGR